MYLGLLECASGKRLEDVLMDRVMNSYECFACDKCNPDFLSNYGAANIIRSISSVVSDIGLVSGCNISKLHEVLNEIFDEEEIDSREFMWDSDEFYRFIGHFYSFVECALEIDFVDPEFDTDSSILAHM